MVALLIVHITCCSSYIYGFTLNVGYIHKTNTYPLNVGLTFLLLKCQFTQAKLSRSCLLALASVHVFIQLFQCQRSVIRFILGKFYTRRTQDVFKYAKSVYLCKYIVMDSLACRHIVTAVTLQLQSMIKGKSSLLNRGSSRIDVARRIPSLIAKLIVDYDWIGNVIDYDTSHFCSVDSITITQKTVIDCNRLRSGEGGVQPTIFCIFNHCYFISSPNNLKNCHIIKQLYIHNIMPKHENTAFQKTFYNQFKKGTFSVPFHGAHSTRAWGTPDRSKNDGLHALHNVNLISHVK